MFNEKYFKKNQKLLLFLCNNTILKYWFRWILRIHKDLKFSEKIISLEPNNYKVLLNNGQIRADFRTHNKFAKRIFYAFKYYWFFRHGLDNCIHFLRSLFDLPKLQFTYDTLTAYPAAGNNTPCDGHAARDVPTSPEAWATIQGGAGTNPPTPIATGNPMVNYHLQTSTTSGLWIKITRGHTFFDISTIGAGGTISAATISGYVQVVDKSFSYGGFTWLICKSIAAATNIIAKEDFTAYDTASFGSISHPTGSGYKSITFNAAGLSYLDTVKTTIAMIGHREGTYDFTGNEPSWESGKVVRFQAYSADNAGTSGDPKLVVTYTPAAAGGNNIIGVL